MNANEFLYKVRPNLRPIGIDTCPTCGKEKQTINKLLNSPLAPRCIPCWQKVDEFEAAPLPRPVRRVAVAQETLENLEKRVSELEGRVAALEKRRR